MRLPTILLLFVAATSAIAANIVKHGVLCISA